MKKQTLKEKIIFLINICLIYTIRFLNKRHLWLINKFNIKKWHFKYMVPEDDAKNIKYYEKQLLEALENKKVKNIAVTGDYGAGKSSFLKTFEKSHKEYSFLDISLATFDENIKDISIIEKSILEQLFYRESINKIPQSRFKKIKSYKRLSIYIKALIGVLTILSILFLLKPEKITSLKIYKLIEKCNYVNYVEYVSIIILLFGLFFTIKYFIKNFNGLTLNKFNLQNVEIEAKKDDEASLLNKYIDEILYFFEKTNYDVILFQDLDRFESSEIFVKLRELNRFLNNAKQVNRRIVFIYVLKDEVFKNQNERVKFFDVMIPIIPYINTKTSYDTLLNWFGSEIDKNFLRDISIFIYDMRLLNNIYNEYEIFKKQIGKGLDKNKLLAMILYKNFYPEDYSKLYKGKSLINNIIKNKYKYIKKLENNNLKQIEEKKQQIQKYKKDLQNNIEVEELRKIYIYEIIKTLGLSNNYFYCDNESITIAEAVTDSNFKIIQTCEDLKKDNYGYSEKSFKEIEKSINPNLSYQEREKLILSKTNNKILSLERDIKKLSKKIESFNGLELKEILNKYDLLNKVKSQYELLKYLLLNGFIEEDYYLYISFDMKTALSSNDIEFLKTLKTDDVLEKDFQLDNIDEIIENLTTSDFSKKSILNINLVSFLIAKQEKYYKKIKNLFRLLSKEDEVIYKFIAYCIDWISNRDKFIRLIVKHNQNIWSILREYGSKESLDSYCGWIFNYADIGDIKKLKKFKEYFENKTFIQSFEENEVQKVITYIKDFNIRFNQLSKISNSKILNYIYDNNHYVLNKKMIDFIVFNLLAPKNEIESKLKKAHLTTIKSLSNSEHLLFYINENISKYIEDIFLEIDTNEYESEETIIELLNNDELEIELKQKIINKEKTKITKIEDIGNKDLWDIIFEDNKIQVSWDNINIYFIKNGRKINKILFNFLNNIKNAKQLSKTKIDDEFCEEKENFDTEILDQIIINNDFELSVYKELLKSNGYWYKNINISNLDVDKIDILLDFGKFQLTKENIDNLKAYSKHIILIERNKDEFFEKIDDFIELFNIYDFKNLLKLQSFSDKEKLEIINRIDLEIIDSELAEIIIKIILTKEREIEKDLILKVFEQLNNKLKYILLYLPIYHINCDELNEILTNFEYPYNQLCLKSNDIINLKITQNNEKLLNILRDKECISSYKKVKDEYKIYRKRK